MKVYYWSNVENAGDYFSIWLLKKMGVDFEVTSKDVELAVTGSILNLKQLDNAKIWGCGYHNADENRKRSESNVFAVRGKLTEKNLGFEVKAKGDPGILASKFYKKISNKKYKFGIVAHYVDIDFFSNINLPSNVSLISMGTNNIEQVIDSICECEFILSSSLHGIIFANSYGIPAIRIKHKELATKKAFKFLDYYSIFDMKYLEKKINNANDLNWDEFDLLYKNKHLFVPKDSEVKKCQDDLLNSFPYKKKDNE